MDFPLQFICAGHKYANFEEYVPAPCFRKSFNLKAQPQKAELLICGLGFYELYINGENITKGPLAPYISTPSHLYYYDLYNIEDKLKAGENVIGVVLGNGMQNSFGGYIWDFEKGSWRGSPKLALKLCAELNGESICIEADESFNTHASPTDFDELRCGEYYDARKEMPGWSAPGFKEEGWSPALIAPRPTGSPALCEAEPIVITHQLKPISIKPVKEGYLYDFGANCAGVPCLKIKGSAGQEVSLEHGEHLLADGSLDLKNIKFVPDGYVQRDKYICKGGEEECFVPRFTYHGFQYIYVTGITEEQAKPQLLSYLVMNSDLKERGSFSCSDETANTLQLFTRRSTLANFYYFPTDCPHREKNGWTGDAALSVEHMLLNINPEQSYKVWLRNICLSQRQQGDLPGIVPTGSWGYHWGNGPAWDCVLTYLPYYTYRYRGDKEILAENSACIFRYLRYVSGRRDEKGLIHIGLGDWCPPARGASDYVSPLEFTDTVMCLDICRKAEQIFVVLGQSLEADYAKKLGDAFKAAIRKHLVDFSTMTVAGSCQTSQAMALALGVFEPGEKLLASKRLVELVEEKDGHFDTGILGARFIFHMLSKAGYSDLAFNMIVREDFPSYGNWIKRGATSLWEDFRPEGEDPASLNHHFFGDISAWFIKRVAGIIVNPKFFNPNQLIIKPCFVSQLTNAKAHHETPFGKIESAWQRSGENEICLKVSVPGGMEGKLVAHTGWRFDDGLGEKPALTGEYKLVRV